MNPEPVADFFDALAIGDGEEVVHEIADAVAAWKGSGALRRELLAALAGIDGVIVLEQLGMPLVGERPVKAVPAVKAPGQGPVRERAGGGGLGGRPDP